MSGEEPNWWDGLGEELQTDIESVEEKTSNLP